MWKGNIKTRTQLFVREKLQQKSEKVNKNSWENKSVYSFLFRITSCHTVTLEKYKTGLQYVIKIQILKDTC